MEGPPKGIGLVTKRPQTDYRRVSFLSRDIAYKDGPIIIRQLVKTILTGSTRTKRVTRDQAHYLSALVHASGSKTPLS